MTAKHNLYIQIITLALISTLVSGCSVRLQNYKEIVTEFFSTPEDVTLSPQEIEEFPYAGSYIQVDERPRAFMALAFDDNGVLKWRTGGEEIIHTKHGRIIGTNNMSGAIAHTSNLSDDPLQCFRRAIIDNATREAESTPNLANCPTTWQRDVWVTTSTPNNLEDQALTYNSEFKIGTTEQINLANGTTHQTIKIEEQSDTITTNVTNTFYISTKTGRIVKSHQLIAPPSTFAIIEEVKPYTLEKVKNNG